MEMRDDKEWQEWLIGDGGGMERNCTCAGDIREGKINKKSGDSAI